MRNNSSIKKNLLKAMSTLLSVLILAQTPMRAYEDEFEYDDEPTESSWVSKKRIIAATAIGAAAIGVPFLAWYLWSRSDKENTKFAKIPQKSVQDCIKELEANYSNLSVRVGNINSQLRSWNSPEGDLKRLQTTVDDLSVLIMGSYDNAKIRGLMNRFARLLDPSQVPVAKLKHQIRAVEYSIRISVDSVKNPSLKQQLGEISESLLRIHDQLRVERSYRQSLNLHPIEGCQLDENGRVYVRNIIRAVDVGGVAKSTIYEHLTTLCNENDVTSGIRTDDAIAEWWRSPAEYYFVPFVGRSDTLMGGIRYDNMARARQLRLAQMIELMYSHKDEASWKPLIQDTLATLATHGGHCLWRAEALVKTAYNLLRNDIIDKNLAGDDKDRGASETSRLFSELKDAIVEKASEEYLRAQEERGEREPLLGLDTFTAHVEEALGMDGDNVRRLYGDDATLFNRVTSKKELINLSNQLLTGKFGEGEEHVSNSLFRDINKVLISFAEYCNIAGKTPEEVRDFINEIRDSDDDELQSWANSEISLPIETIYEKTAILLIDQDVMGKWKGFRFLALCYREHYLEDRIEGWYWQ